MLRKLFIRTWFGPLPPWFPHYQEHVKALAKIGFDFLIVNDYEWFRDRCRQKLGVEINVIPGTRKAGDFDPVYGVIFEDELKDYEFWGHTGLDCVYGRLDRFVPDEFLANVDIFGNDPNAICGPFSLYRNIPHVNYLFMDHPEWRQILESSTMYGFDEIQFNGVVQAAAAAGDIRFKSAFWQSHDKQPQHVPTPRLSILPDGTLMDAGIGREIMMFHFNRPVSDAPFGGRTWPVS